MTSRSRRAGQCLVQMAVGTVLVAGTVLAVSEFMHAQATDLGFRVDEQQVVQVRLPTQAPGEQIRRTGLPLRRFVRTHRVLLERIAALPGVAAVASVTVAPLLPGGPPRLQIPLDHAGAPAVETDLSFQRVSPEYFGLMRIPLKSGRTLTADDALPESVLTDRIQEFQGVAIVSEDLARLIGGAQAAIGQRLRIPEMTRIAGREVVGVVGDVKGPPYEDATPTVYVPFDESPYHFLTYVVEPKDRIVVSPSSIEAAVQSVAASEAVVTEIRDMRTLRGDVLRREWFSASLLSVLGVIGVFVAGSGMYAATTASVAAAKRESAVRMALGATRWDTLRRHLKRDLLWLSGGLFVSAWVVTLVLPEAGMGILWTHLERGAALVAWALAGAIMLGAYAVAVTYGLRPFITDHTWPRLLHDE